MNKSLLVAVTGFFLALPALPANAQDWYVSLSAGAALQADSSNTGTTGAFTTGNGAPTLPFGTPVAAGTAYGWETEFSEGRAVSGEAGLAFGNGLRAGLEIAAGSSDVETHKGVNVAGTVIDGVDAAVLTGSATPLGATVGAVVADGRGEISSTGVYANVYYDLLSSGPFIPYVGAGLGYSRVKVTYQPSGVGIIDDSENKLSWQVRGGAAWSVSERIDLFAEATYRATEDVTLENKLFPGTLDIENKQTIFSLGLRYRFGT